MKLIFNNVSQIHNRKKQIYDLLDINYAFQMKKNVAILTVHERSSLTLVRLIAGINQPTRGSVKRDGLFSTPIGDTQVLHRELSGEENIRFISRMYGQETERVIADIKEMASLGNELKQKTKTYHPTLKRKIAISLALNMKFDVYQITGSIQHPDKNFNQAITLKLNELSGNSTLIIATQHQATINKFADYSVVIDTQGHLKEFKDVASGIDAQAALKKAI